MIAKRVLWILSLYLALLMAACQQTMPGAVGTVTTTPTATENALVVTATPLPEGQAAAPTEAPLITTPTPEPTATPGPIEEAVSEFTSATGLRDTVFLGLTGEDWVNLGVSLLIVAIGVLILSRIIYYLLYLVARILPGEKVEQYVRSIRSQIYILVGLIIISYATSRLPFLSANAKEVFNQLFFAGAIIALTGMAWKLIDLAVTWYEEARVPEGEVDQHTPFAQLIRSVLLGLLVIIATTVVLNSYGVNITVLLVIIGIGALAVTFAAQDTLRDLFYGFIILFDRPFRVGDRIELQELNTWGDVVEIGTRTTRIRTRDNRMVIVPNSSIGKGQIVNYSYPDTHYRVQIELDIAYGTDLDLIRQTIIHSIDGIDGVLTEKPIDALLFKFGDYSLKYRVRWWINSYIDTYAMYDRVHNALYRAFDEKGIEMPYATYDINLRTSAPDVIDQPERSDKGVE
jgi:small-conductance mechanosensitive channel